MSLRTVLQKILFTVLIPLSISSALCLYLYPVLQGCAFPLPIVTKPNEGTREGSWLSNSVINTLYQHAADWNLTSNGGEDEPAIFRLLVLADPQIEGDSSLPSPDDDFIPRLRRHWVNVQSVLSTPDATTILKDTAQTIFTEDIPFAFRAARKRLDLLGNDYYLAHIYRTLSWWSRPTHVTVLGDLIGSQWVTDDEFENRGWRFWQRVFQGGQRVDDGITGEKSEAEGSREKELETLQRYNSTWANRIINIAGNHDIGYAGDVSRSRLERFERVFGRANWDIRFAHPPLPGKDDARPTLHIINLNDLTLDGPPLESSIQSDSYTYINDLLTRRSYPVEDRTSFTLLLTHVPLHKRDGTCVDGPYFTYFDEDDTPDDDSDSDSPRWRKDGLREQNHLSEHVSTNGILEGIFGMSGDSSAPVAGRGRRGLILTGHDHEGCDAVHFVNREHRETSLESESEEGTKPWHWDAMRYSPSSFTVESKDDSNPSIREVTLRSMMGEYDGNAALLSLWFDTDPEVNQWRYEIQMCPAGVQHIWWAVHGLAVACVIGLGVVGGLKGLGVLGILSTPARSSRGAGVRAKKH